MNISEDKIDNIEYISSNYEISFFNDNITSLNKFYTRILFSINIVPILFIILTILNVWIVSYVYSVCLLTYTIAVSITEYYINKKEKYRYFSMYFGLFSSLLFVFALSLNSVIQISLAYTFVPILSCLYYKTALTKKISLANYALTIIAIVIRRYCYPTNTDFCNYTTQNVLLISDIIGYSMQYAFLYLLVDYSSSRSYMIIMTNLRIADEKKQALVQIKTQNDEIKKMNKSLSEKNNNLVKTQEEILKFIAEVLGSHDLYTGHHVIHTQKYVELICLQLVKDGHYTDILTPKTIYQYKTAALLHDIGKIHIPEIVLNKIGKFSEDDFTLMKNHTVEGQKLLVFLPEIDGGNFNIIAKQIAYSHHEKWDGKGYPEGIKGTDIPLCARIMAAADVLDALISQRLYKRPFSIDEAMDIFVKERGHQFEPCISDAIIKLKDKIIPIDKYFKESEINENTEELEWWKNFHSTHDSSVS